METPTMLPMDNLQVLLILEELGLPHGSGSSAREPKVVIIQSRAEVPNDQIGKPDWITGDLKAWVLDWDLDLAVDPRPSKPSSIGAQQVTLRKSALQ